MSTAMSIVRWGELLRGLEASQSATSSTSELQRLVSYFISHYDIFQETPGMFVARRGGGGNAAYAW